MKHAPLLFIFSLFFLLVGCQESSSKKSRSSNPYCSGANYYNPGCPGSGGGFQGGSVGGGYCHQNPYDPACGGATVGGTGGGGVNPHPHYYSAYVDKNWTVSYPFVPSLNCQPAQDPPGVEYTPYDTRKGTVTLRGQINYDPASNEPYFDTTSNLLQTVNGARNFFWGDSTLKVRFKSNIQPSSANTTNVCPKRNTGSTIKGYGRIKFDLHLVGRRANGQTVTESLGTKIIDVNSCSPAIDLSNHVERFPNGIYLKVSNIYGNQEWSPGTFNESRTYDTYGFIFPQNPHVENKWKIIRTLDCWSLDIEVAADGTKTFN